MSNHIGQLSPMRNPVAQPDILTTANQKARRWKLGGEKFTITVVIFITFISNLKNYVRRIKNLIQKIPHTGDIESLNQCG